MVYNCWEKEEKLKQVTPLDKLKCELDYICNHIKDEELAGYLVDESMSGYIRYFGSEGMEAFLPLYREKVKNEKQKAAFFRSYEQYTRLEKGRKAPHFSLLDKDGNRKNLSDWLGNYVYTRCSGQPGADRVAANSRHFIN